MRFNNYTKVRIADYKVLEYPENGIYTLGLGSCVAICLYDNKRKIGGLAHILLPANTRRTIPNEESVKLKYADYTVPKMINEMLSMGCKKSNIVAVIAGGGNMFSTSYNSQNLNIGERNQEAVINILNEHNIPIVARSLGGNTGKTVYFSLENGEVYIRQKNVIEKLYQNE